METLKNQAEITCTKTYKIINFKVKILNLENVFILAHCATRSIKIEAKIRDNPSTLGNSNSTQVSGCIVKLQVTNKII